MQRTPPLVTEMRKVGYALALVVGFWAVSQTVIQYKTLEAIRRTEAVTVTRVDTINTCRRDDRKPPDTPF